MNVNAGPGSNGTSSLSIVSAKYSSIFFESLFSGSKSISSWKRVRLATAMLTAFNGSLLYKAVEIIMRKTSRGKHDITPVRITSERLSSLTGWKPTKEIVGILLRPFFFEPLSEVPAFSFSSCSSAAALDTFSLFLVGVELSKLLAVSSSAFVPLAAFRLVPLALLVLILLTVCELVRKNK